MLKGVGPQCRLLGFECVRFRSISTLQNKVCMVVVWWWVTRSDGVLLRSEKGVCWSWSWCSLLDCYLKNESAAETIFAYGWISSILMVVVGWVASFLELQW